MNHTLYRRRLDGCLTGDLRPGNLWRVSVIDMSVTYIRPRRQLSLHGENSAQFYMGYTTLV